MPGPLSVPNGDYYSVPHRGTNVGEKRVELAERKKLATGKTRIKKGLERRWDDYKRNR